MILTPLFDWMTVRDYDKAKADALRRIVARFSRGNIKVQRGRYLDDRDFVSFVERGDAAMNRLERAAKRN